MGRAEQINRALGKAGLPQLREAASLFSVFAYAIRTDEQFKKLLAKVEPDKRHVCYNALRGKLHFKVRSLEDYMLEIKQDAEREQLPTLSADGTQVIPFSPARDANTARAEKLVAQKWATLTCYKCTGMQDFPGNTPIEARIAAVKAGWVRDKERDEWICPECPAVRPN